MKRCLLSYLEMIWAMYNWVLPGNISLQATLIIKMCADKTAMTSGICMRM